jgi:glucose-6-phosphate 1-dehydrogenase
MNKSEELKKKSEIVLESLKKSVAKALERKRLLGQYAVISQDGKIVKLFNEKEKCD